MKIGNLEIPDNIEQTSTDKLMEIFKPLKKRYYQYHAKGAREAYLRVVAELQKRGKVAFVPLNLL